MTPKIPIISTVIVATAAATIIVGMSGQLGSLDDLPLARLVTIL